MKLNDIEQFKNSVQSGIDALGKNTRLHQATMDWFLEAGAARYSYHFSAFGLPIIQFPQDMVAIQEIVWSVKPDLIIETGIARGGSLAWSAGLLALLDLEEAASTGGVVNPRASKRKVLGIDIDIRPHNRSAIAASPFSSYIEMIEGSSVDDAIIKQVWEFASGFNKILVFLDSNHTHQHVLDELKAYAPLASVDSYCVVFDTMIEDSPQEASGDRPWGPGNSPKTAVDEYLKTNTEFVVDTLWDNKLQITVARGGYLKRVR